MAADPPTSSISSSNGAEALSTAHLYYEDTELFSNTAIIAAIQPGSEGQVEEGTATLVLDQTVMHPQGGGQPADTGVISSSDGTVRFEVSHVQKPRDAAYIQHVGKYTTAQRFLVGAEVGVEIDAGRRMRHARLHSAGHLLDSALINIGVSDLIPSKGYHFPDGPYVEYIGNVAVEKREEVLAALNKEANRLIQEAIPVAVTKNDKGERNVDVGGVGCACGGTHVKSTADIRGITVTKIKKSKKNVRISYLLSDE